MSTSYDKFERASAKGTNQKSRAPMFPARSLAVALVMSMVATILIILFVIVLSFGGPDLALPSMIGMGIVLLGGLAADVFVLVYGARRARKAPSKAGDIPGYDRILKDRPVPVQWDTSIASMQNSTPYPEKQPTRAQTPYIVNPPSSIVQKPKAYGDPIIGIWYGPGKSIKTIFYHDGTFDLITGAQYSQDSWYMGGTYRKNPDGSYRIRLEFEGSSKAVARQITENERQFILDGDRIYDANDESVQFFK